MRHFARLSTLGLIAVFVAGCWSEPIQIRKTDETDQTPFASRSKERRALMKELGKAPAETEAPAVEGAEKH